MQCSVCNEEMKRTVTFSSGGPECNVVHRCSSQCEVFTAPLSTEEFDADLVNAQLVSIFAQYTGQSANAVWRIFMNAAKPIANGVEAVHLEELEEPLGLPAGFFSAAIDYAEVS